MTLETRLESLYRERRLEALALAVEFKKHRNTNNYAGDEEVIITAQRFLEYLDTSK